MLLLVTLVACEPADPMAKFDRRYGDIMRDVGASGRDTTKNVHNKEAGRRKGAAEGARVAFFRDPEVQAAIKAAAAAPAGTVEQVKGESYVRAQLVSAAWTEAEKEEETRLVSALDVRASSGATWFSTDGGTKIDIAHAWDDLGERAERLDEAGRQSLAEAWVEHRMQRLGPELQALVKLRNEVARRAGYADYWELALAGQGLTPQEVEEIITELTPVVRPLQEAVRSRVVAAGEAAGLADTFANRLLLRRKAGLEAGTDAAQAWFDGDLAEDRVLTALQDMGITTNGWQIYTGESRNVRAGVYGFAIEPPQHLAIVMSMDERYSMWPYEALAHEAGHAVWWRGLSPELAASPALWEPTPPWFEGFAQFFERMVFEPAFAAKYVPELPEADRDALWRSRARDAAERIVDAIVDTRAERRLYQDPSDLGAICAYAAGLRQELGGTPPPPTTASGIVYDPSLLSSLMWNEPAYSQNYLFAYMTEAWMWEGVKAQVGDPVANPKVGPLVHDRIVRQPATMRFPERIAALGSPDRAAAVVTYLKVGIPDPPGAR